jgi:hypothetical protein
MSKCVSWKKKWIRTVAWGLELDGRRDRDGCAKPTIVRAGNLSDGIVAVFFMVRFQEKEVRKALRKKHAEKVWQGGHYDDVPNVEMFLDPWKVVGSPMFRYYAERRNEGLGKSWYL